MAYGTIKADTITYDNSGSDVNTTIASLVAPKEGTAIVSTGESGGTKFLREDGDGSCSWQTIASVPTSITVTDESSDTTCFPLFVTAATGELAPKTGTNITFNASTGKLVIGGDLQVDGTTTTVNSTTMTVTDKNIEIAKGAANDAAADGAGITVDSGDGVKTWNWVNATDAWTANQNIALGDNLKAIYGNDGDLKIFHNGTNNYIDVEGDGVLYVRPKANFYLQNYTTGEVSIAAIPDGTTELYHNGIKKIETTAAGVTVAGTVTDTKGDVRSIPANVQTGAYTLVASDAGKFIRAQATITVPNNIFSAGDAVTIVNNTGSAIAINQGIGFMYMTSDGSTGNRSLAARGVVTILFVTANICYISGGGLS